MLLDRDKVSLRLTGQNGMFVGPWRMKAEMAKIGQDVFQAGIETTLAENLYSW